MKKMYLWQIGIYGIVAAVAAIFWIQYVVVGAKEVAIRYGYEQYYFHLFAARPLLYFALGALGVTVLQWAGGMLLRRGARPGLPGVGYCPGGVVCRVYPVLAFRTDPTERIPLVDRCIYQHRACAVAGSRHAVCTGLWREPRKGAVNL